MSCLFSSDINHEKFVDEPEKLIILVKFEDEIIFLVSKDGINFSFIPSKTIEIVKTTWFNDDKPKHILFKELSKLSMYRKVFHEPEYFVKRIKKVYFHYINKQVLPYRYSVKVK